MNELPSRVDVLCNACGRKAMEDDDFTIDFAWAPRHKPGPGETACLMAPTLADVNPLKLQKAKRMRCEGCNAVIYVAPSSKWLLDLKAEIER